MKIEIKIDVTPEEMRRFFGLPDVKSVQDELLGKLREQIEAGTAELDPARLMQAFVAPASSTMEAMQKAFSQAFATAKRDDDRE